MPDNNGTQPFSEQERALAQELWAKCCTFLSTQIEPAEMANWINPIEAKGLRNNELVLLVPSETFLMYLEEKYSEPINLMNSIYLSKSGIIMLMEYPETKEAQLSLPSTESRSKRERSAEAYTNVFNSALNFDTFIESHCNRVARMVAESVALHPGQAPLNILFIYGPSGVGKTHLSQAIGQRVRMLHPDKRVCYVSCAKFEAQYSQDARFHEKSAFFEVYQQVDVLIIDDIQGLVGKTKTQQAFFEIFNHLSLLNKQIVLTCDVPPAEFRGIEERILTRLQSSMLVALERPDLELRRKILKSRIAEAGVTLGEEVVDYIASNMQSNVRELEGAMKTLITYAQIQRQPIDLGFATSIMSQSISMSRPTPTLESISRFVAEEFGIAVEDLRSSSRAKKFAHPRQIVMYLCDKHTDQTLVSIAQKLKRKNHTTVMHGIRSIANLIEQNQDFRSSIGDLEQRLLARG